MRLWYLPRLRRERVCLPGDLDKQSCFGYLAPDDRLASSGLCSGNVAVARPPRTVETFGDGDLLVVARGGGHRLKRARVSAAGSLLLEDDAARARPLLHDEERVEAKVVHICRGGDHAACGLRRVTPAADLASAAAARAGAHRLLLDARGDPLHVPTDMLHRFGLSDEEQREHGWKRLLHPDDVEPVMRAWLDSLHTGALYHAAPRVRDLSGAYVILSTVGHPVYGSDERIEKWELLYQYGARAGEERVA